MRRRMYCKCWQWIGVIAVCVCHCRIAECFVGCRQGRGSPFRAQVGFELTLGKSSAFWTRITGETGARIIRSFRGGASSIHRRSDVGIVHLWWLVGYEWLDFVAFDVPTCRRADVGGMPSASTILSRAAAVACLCLSVDCGGTWWGCLVLLFVVHSILLLSWPWREVADEEVRDFHVTMGNVTFYIGIRGSLGTT